MSAIMSQPTESPGAPPSLHIEPSFALPIVHLSVAFRRGAADDPIGKDGLSRIVARMLRRGARGMSSAEIEERIDALGASLSAEVSPTVVSFHADVISRSLDDFIDLLAKLFSEPSFDEVELGRLLRESEGELVEARDSDRALVTRYFRRKLFEGHPYGRRLGGQIPSLRGIDRGDVVSAYERIFTRDQAVIAFSGDITEARANELAKRLLEGLPERGSEADPIPEPSIRRGRRLVFVDKPERTQTQILIGTLGSHPKDADHIPLQVATTVFGGTFTSRLMREVRSKRGWSYGAYARLPYEQRRDAFSMWTFPAATDAAACIALKLELLHTWREKGISPRELSFVKKFMVRSHAFEIDTADKRVHLRLETDLLGLPPDYHARYLEHVKAVELEAANQAVRERISEEDLLITVVGTHSAIGDAVARAIPNLDEVIVVPFDTE